ncbi:MAG: carboxymuconolactone decarboxylase family protein [Dokdonella sp.]|nr:MAG: carboxymuconolactone decarboxylase family protein [Gammaproteobacteria bacterium]TXI72988.1 MAG: carboxymuconolactone decarboxylase family protein [Dokdonella sp.]
MDTSTHHTALPAQRLNFFALGPDTMRAMGVLDQRIANSDLEKSLVELIRIRVSQINGCAYCVDRHTADARRAGEDQRRLTTLSVWRDTPFFTARERAALAWAEALTRIADAHVTDELWELVEGEFVPSQLIDLTLAINAVNDWNRFGIAFRKLPS